MKTTIAPPWMGLLGIMALFSAGAAAGEIYKWVTPDGVTHFSETPPAAAVASLEVVELDVAPPGQPAPGGYQSVLDVARSIEASRLERERLQLEKRKLRLERESQPRTPETAYGAPPVRIYYPPYRRYAPPPHYRDRFPKPRGWPPRSPPAPEPPADPVSRINTP